MTNYRNGFSLYSIKGSCIFAFILFVIGLILQFLFGSIPIEKLKFPINLYFFIELFFITLALWIIFKKQKVVQWLASSQSALSSISLFVFIVSLMAIIPQNDSEYKWIENLGLNSMIYSWMYAISVSYFLLILGLITIRRVFPLSWKNIAFLINHFGLWLAMSSSILGFADKQQLIMPVNVNQLVWYAENDQKVITELPFALKLEKFVVKYHHPKIALMSKDGEPYRVKGDQLKEIKGKECISISGHPIEILDFYEHAYLNGDTIVNATGVLGTTIAVKIRTVLFGDSLIETWLSPGNYMNEGMYLNFHPDTILGILNPEPSYYGSEVLLYTKSGIDGEPRTIAVNKPISAEGWTIYQYSYDARLGKDSPYSVFSIIKDPWLPIVYVGIFLMMAGSILLLFSRNINKNNKTSTL